MTLADGYFIAYRTKEGMNHSRLMLGVAYKYMREDGVSEFRLADIRRILRHQKRLHDCAKEVLS